MVAIPITRPRSLVVGSPEYFKGRSKPIVPLDLVQHRCIEMRMANGRMYRWEFERRGEAHVIDVPGNLTLTRRALSWRPRIRAPHSLISASIRSLRIWLPGALIRCWKSGALLILGSAFFS